MNDPILRTIENRDIYPEKLRGEIADFNSAVETLEAARATLSTEADEMRSAAVMGRVEKPDRLPADAAKLAARQVMSDLQEIRLIERKTTFQKPILEARAAERDRLLKLEKERREEIAAIFAAAKTETRFMPGILNGDSRVLDLTAQRSTVSGFLKIVTEEDDLRLAFLQGRVSAVIPKL